MTRRHLLSPIAARLALAFVAVALAAIAVLALLTVAGTRRQVSGLVSQQHQDRVRAVAAAAGQAYDDAHGWTGADLTAAATLAAVADADLVIQDAAGAPVATGTAHAQMMRQLRSRMHDAASAEPLSVGSPLRASVLSNGRVVGTVALRFPTGGLPAPEARVRDALAQVVVVGATLAALVALAAAVVVSRRITRPLVRLTGAVQAIEGGAREARSGLTDAPGELGELAGAVDRMADTLAHQDQLRRDLVADVAHELRTPLTILQASCEALLDGVETPTPDRLVSLHDEVLRLGRVVEDLETLSAAEAAGLRLDRRTVDLAAIAAGAIESLRPRATESGLTVEQDLAEVTVHVDPTRIHQVAVNLLTNALKFTPAGGTVLVRVSGDDALARLEVTDTGPGVPADELPRVFDRFWRGRSATGTSGSGIGLAVVAELVRAHRGRVEVHSDPGRATTFTVLLPRP